MKTADFEYILPPERIAQEPVRPRDASRLLVLNRETGAAQDRVFSEIGEFLRPGDLLVVNRSKVFKARLAGVIASAYTNHARQSPDSGDCFVAAAPRNDTKRLEIFLLRPEGAVWTALAKPGRKLKPGSEIEFSDGSACRVVEKNPDGTVSLDFGATAAEVLALTEKIGQVPTPPYVEKTVTDPADYQTVYAKEVGSVAAPTAGFHFTPELIEKLKRQGINFAEVILHVGLGTFRPIKTETLEEHAMHEEWLEVPPETRRAIQAAKTSGNRVIAVGTTTVRALESGLEKGATRIFITPGYQFKTVDALITNFHLPKSTLLVLVSAFTGEKHADSDWGRRTILAAYQDAIAKGYRFYSFGDAMFVN
ncbi:MAG: tRNA preQ1(34) S-adenosylmethionine ribosyltransferase-isomerase QueA [Patescibacteria group bacterium]